MPRYDVEKYRAWSQVVQWGIRARLIDNEGGGFVEFRSLALAREAAELLGRAELGDLPTPPAEASPFAAYDVSHGADGWIYIWIGDGALSHRAVARSKSEELARRVADLLSRAHARELRSWRGPIKSYF